MLSENLAAYQEGKYGGSYENRTVAENALKKISEEVDIDLAVRLNTFDSIPYPYGWELKTVMKTTVSQETGQRTGRLG